MNKANATAHDTGQATPTLPHHHSPPSLKREMEGTIFFHFALTSHPQRLCPALRATACGVDFFIFILFYYSS
jgi:hypothetical protein